MAATDRMFRAVDVWRGHCSKAKFYAWARQGRIRLYKVGGNSYCDESFADIVRRLAAEDEAAGAVADRPGKAGRDAAAARCRAGIDAGVR